MDESRQKTIKEIYETNFGTAYETYKDAVKKDSSIRLQDVKDYLNSRDEKQTHLNIRNIIVLYLLALISSTRLI